MPRSTIEDRRAVHLIDALTTVRDGTSGMAAPVAVTTSEAGIGPTDLTRLHSYGVAVHAVAQTGVVAGSDEWTVSAEVAASAAGPWIPVGSVTLSGEDQRFAIPLEGYYLQQVDADVAYVRTTATLAGAAGPLQYSAYLSVGYAE